jgi:hypothetical protein
MRRGRSRRAFVGLLVVTAVLAATLATTAVLRSGGDGGTAAIAPGRVPDVSVTAKPPSSAALPSPVLVIDITVDSGGRAELALLGGAAFRNGDSKASVRLHAGPNRFRLALSHATAPGRYGVRILLESTAGRPIAIERSFRLASS